MATTTEGVRYKDKVTVVTGGAQGLGQACVEVFAEHGSKVVIADIKDDVGQVLADSLNKAGLPGQVLFVKCDVTKIEDIKRLIQKTVDTFGRIDCLINNAGTSPGAQTIDTTSFEEFRSLLDLNLSAPFQVSKEAISYIREVKGNIINMASICGVLTPAHNIAYVSSKAGLIGLTKTMAVDEAKYGVRVNCISPGPFDTPLHRWAMSTAGEGQFELCDKHAQFIGRTGDPREIGKACLFLATDATYSTGLNLLISGGCELDFGLKFNVDKLLK